MGGELSGEDRVLGLVGDIYDAALDPSLWPVVLDRIGETDSMKWMSSGLRAPV
jgi:hypothetical protein